MRRACSKRSKTISCKQAVAILVILSANCLGEQVPGTPQSPASPTITNRTYRYQGKGGEIIGFYPALDDPGDRVAEDMFNRRVDQFLNERRRELGADRKKNPLTLRLNYEAAIARSGVISIRFELLAEERQMAHPSHLYIPLIIDNTQHKEIQLSDLFVPGSPWLAELVRLARADLSARDLPTTEDWIEKGTEPNAGNFSVFRLTDKTLEIFFPEYQVAPYGAGLQRVIIPLAELKNCMLPRFLAFSDAPRK